MRREDWTLLVLSAAGGKQLTPSQIQKCMFLLGKGFPDQINKSEYYNFQHYYYGAFDPQVYHDAERMQRDGLTTVSRSPDGWKLFSSTPKGLETAERLRANLPPQTADYIDRLVNWACGLSFAELIRAVYRAHPETQENSIFKETG